MPSRGIALNRPTSDPFASVAGKANMVSTPAPPPPQAFTPAPQPQYQEPAPQPTTPAAAPTAAPAPYIESPAPTPAAVPAPQPAVAALQQRAELDPGTGWETASTPGLTRPGLGQRLPFMPAAGMGGVSY